MVNRLSTLEAAFVAYGVTLTTSVIQELYERFVDLHRQWSGELPSLAVIHGAGFSGKKVTFKAADRKLKKLGFDGVAHVTLFSTFPGIQPQSSGYTVYSNVDTERAKVILAGTTSYLLLDGAMQARVEAIFDLCRARYGYGLTRETDRGGPISFYARGMATYLDKPSLEEEEEQLTTQWWGFYVERQKVYENGELRDLYPWNYLNEKQLAMPIGGTTLRDWIRSDASRGLLEDRGSGLMLWSLTPVQITELRDTVKDAGLLFNWKHYRDRES